MPFDHFIQIYKTKAAAYHALIAAEDVDGHLLPTLQAITPLAGKRVLDLGSGSGRIPILLSRQGNKETSSGPESIIAVDLYHAMLMEQAKHFSSLRAQRSNPPEISAITAQPTHPHLLQADLRCLPLARA